ncbi:methylaspartate mutase subunit E [Inquilinus limosus]|uniref:methylaspartate mutase subunit E n=1 Tax=Inquilinus limosus TaxID=171674 RepID=UPI003F173F84
MTGDESSAEPDVGEEYVRKPRASAVIALGGVGGDAHSVGLFTLRRALRRAGFRVYFLGTQNSAEELCRAAAVSDAILVSNMDGHAKHYLANLPNLRAEHGGGSSLWYLGGNPSLDGDRETHAFLASLGFKRVFLSYVSPEEVIKQLDVDLASRGRPNVSINHIEEQERRRCVRERNAGSDELVEGNLFEQRPTVLAQWPSGDAAADLVANAEALVANVTLAQVQAAASRDGRTLIHPRSGVAAIDRQSEIFAALREAGADVLSFQIDSLTRNNSYAHIEKVLTGWDRETPLNGFPAVNHGVAAVRTLVSKFAMIPMQVRHSTRDPRLLAEIAYASGITAFEGGAITYNLPYYRNYPPRISLGRWRYVDQLTGFYATKFGITIDREFFGPLTATLVPPCLATVACVFEALLAAEQGVKSVSLGYAEQGNREQDIAAIGALRKVSRQYLDRFGFSDVSINTVFHQFMGAFPLSQKKARNIIRNSAVTAALSGATRLMVKTEVEALRIPTAEENAAAIRLIRSTIEEQRSQAFDQLAVAQEEAMIVSEASAILDAALIGSGGDIGEAMVLAIERGYLDVPFSPSIWNAGKVIAVRDCSGAVRLADPGNMPLPPEVIEYHRDLVSQRLKADRRHLDELIEQDILFFQSQRLAAATVGLSARGHLRRGN